MGILLAHPCAEWYPFAPQKTDGHLNVGDPPDQEKQQLADLSSPARLTWRKKRTREQLRTYMITHSKRGNKLSKVRQPFVGELVPLTSPEESDVTFQIKRFNNRDIMSYRDKNSKVRYIMEDDEEDRRMITEKDYPVGSMRIDVVELGLAAWNITDSAGTVIPLSRETILGYLMPEELDAIYDKVIEINPQINGEAARKKD